MGAQRRASQNGKRAKRYGDAVAGSRASGRGWSRKGPQRWIAGDIEAGLFRRRRDALRHCPAGVFPRLVRMPPLSNPGRA